MSLTGGPQDPYSTPQQPAGGVPVPPTPPPPTPYGGPAVPPPGYGAPGYGPAAPGYGMAPSMPPTGYGPMAGTEKNGLGTWALVLGIVSFFCGGFITGIAAVIVGTKSQQAQATGQANNGNLGRIGVILGWIAIVLSVIGIAIVINAAAKGSSY
jgi:hypothetical protein